MNDLKEYIFPYESFIGGWYIPEKLCDDIINYFNVNKHKTSLGKLGGGKVNFDKKKSIDLGINIDNFNYPFNEYQKYLSQITKNFESKYDDVKDLDYYGLVEGYNIQYYEKNAGFKIWHCERGCNLNRNLVFMTYLNDVKDGGTEFKYQKIITTAKKGLTLIWPTDWTHTHRGQISKTSEKYIVTGWFGYLPEEIKK
jgi:hypothetical protein